MMVQIRPQLLTLFLLHTVDQNESVCSQHLQGNSLLALVSMVNGAISRTVSAILIDFRLGSAYILLFMAQAVSRGVLVSRTLKQSLLSVPWCCWARNCSHR